MMNSGVSRHAHISFLSQSLGLSLVDILCSLPYLSNVIVLENWIYPINILSIYLSISLLYLSNVVVLENLISNIISIYLL